MGIIDNIGFLCKKWYSWDRKGLFIGILSLPIKISIPLLTSLLLKHLIDLISSGGNGQGFLYFAIELTIQICFLGVLKTLAKYIDARSELFQLIISRHFASELIDHSVRIAYKQLEKTETRVLFEKSKKLAFDDEMRDGGWAFTRLVGLLTSIFGVLSYGIILTRLRWWVFAIVILSCSLEYLLDYQVIRLGDNIDKNLIPDEMKSYYFFKVAASKEAERDLHVNQAQKWIIRHLGILSDSYTKTLHQYTIGATKYQGYKAIITMFRDVCIFILLTRMMAQNQISFSEFVFYFGILSEFSIWVSGIYGHLASLSRISLEVDYYRSFMNIPINNQTDFLVSCDQIEFRDVAFSYSEKGPIILKHISFVVSRGDAIAIVGANGSGKTTLLKILAGFYDPTEGEVLINGNVSYAFERENSSLTSAIFQDHLVLPDSIKNNVTFGISDDFRFWEAMEKANIKNRVLSSNKDQIINDIEEEMPTELSGGELQRLLIARVFFHKTSIMLFDEPASALDPIAEETLYKDILQIASDSIVFIVSHRLTSTNFCKKILYIKDGTISGFGSHEELMNSNIDYREMYKIQASYYEEHSCNS